MLRIDSKYINEINDAEKPEDLQPMLQNAIELEHSTIPPYLTALFSIKPGTEQEAATIIHDIVIEEMLHMTIAANILNALRGEPDINKPEFIPKYPGPLPMGIGSEHGLIVGLERYSLAQVEKVFMEIEEPEEPLPLQAKLAEEETYSTIGAFYMAIQQKLKELGPGLRLPGDPNRQVVSEFFSKEQLYPIYTVQDAINAIDIIIEQGEGTSVSPVDMDGEIAHYYRFQELVKGRRLVKDPSAPYGYSYSGREIPFDARNVQPITPNTRVSMLPEGTEAAHLAAEFRSNYLTLLDGLQRTFSGNPAYLSNAIGVMYDMRLNALKLAAMPFPGKPGYTVGPTFMA